MSNIVIYKDIVSLYDDLRPKSKKFLDSGREGNTYTDGKYAYKYYLFPYPKNEVYRKNVSKIITTSDFDLESFAFPMELYVVDNTLMANKSLYFKSKKPNVFFKNFNVDAFIEAYQKMLKDVEVLSNNGIEINDLAGNLLYDGKKLVGIDTGFYDKNSFLLDVALHEYNLYVYKSAIAHLFQPLAKKYPEVDDYFGYDVSSETDIEKGVKTIGSLINKGQV